MGLCHSLGPFLSLIRITVTYFLVFICEVDLFTIIQNQRINLSKNCNSKIWGFNCLSFPSNLRCLEKKWPPQSSHSRLFLRPRALNLETFHSPVFHVHGAIQLDQRIFCFASPGMDYPAWFLVFRLLLPRGSPSIPESFTSVVSDCPLYCICSLHIFLIKN